MNKNEVTSEDLVEPALSVKVWDDPDNRVRKLQVLAQDERLRDDDLELDSGPLTLCSLGCPELASGSIYIRGDDDDRDHIVAEANLRWAPSVGDIERTLKAATEDPEFLSMLRASEAYLDKQPGGVYTIYAF